jgi:hypothetical protein
VGLAASLLLSALALAVFERTSLHLEAWLQDPLEQLQSLGQQLFGYGSGTAVFRCFLLTAVLSVVWSFVGGWIARSELLRHRATTDPVQTTATQFVRGKASSLIMLLLPLLICAGICLVPGLLAGLFNRVLGLGLGAILVSLLFPVVLVSTLAFVLLLIGSLSCGIMPAALAAEGKDSFDAFTRGCSYLYQRPLLFGWWSGICLALSSLPLAGVLWLLHKEPNLLGPAARSFALAAGAALSLSLFWTLQSLVYLKMRRLVDGTSEEEVWDGPINKVSAADAPEHTTDSQPDASAGELPQAASAETAAGPALPKRSSLSFRDTLSAGGALELGRLVVLGLGVLWVALVLTLGTQAVWGLAGGQGQGMTPEGLWQAILTLAEQKPETLFGLVVGVVVLGALGLGTPIKVAARMASVRLAYESRISLRAAWPFARRTRGLGIGSVLLATAGIALLLLTGFLTPLAVKEAGMRGEVGLLGGLAVALLELGVLGLGAVAVEGKRRDMDRPGLIGTYLGNGLETGASAAAELVLVPLGSAAFLGIIGLTWFFACESVSWWGGEKVQWVRWGLGDTLVPESEGGLYWAASLIAGFWFLLLFGLALMYPLSSLLTWGAACYLRARQQTEEISPGQLELSREEQVRLRWQRQKQKRWQQQVRETQERMKSRRRRRELAKGTVEGSESEVVPKSEEERDSGAPLVKIRCLKCKALNEESAKFCNQCGSVL